MRWLTVSLIGLGTTLPGCPERDDGSGVVLVYERRFINGPSCPERLVATAQRLRYESCDPLEPTPEPRTIVWLDLGEDDIVQLTPADQTYRLWPRGDDTPAAPPMPDGAPRAELQRLISEGVMAPPDVQPTDMQWVVAGLPCRVHRVSRGGRATADVCVVAWDDAPVSRDLLDALGTLEAEHAAAPGLPVLSITFDADGHERERTTVVEVRRQTIARSTWAIPAGYRQAPR